MPTAPKEPEPGRGAPRARPADARTPSPPTEAATPCERRHVRRTADGPAANPPDPHRAAAAKRANPDGRMTVVEHLGELRRGS